MVVCQPATKRNHIYCSKKNPGALELLDEFTDNQGLTLKVGPSSPAPSRRRSSAHVNERKGTNVPTSTLHVTHDVEQVAKCDAMLVYLTAQTWTRAEESSALGAEVGMAMDAGTRLLLTHEMIGVGGQQARFGCEFASFFSCDEGATPPDPTGAAQSRNLRRDCNRAEGWRVAQDEHGDAGQSLCWRGGSSEELIRSGVAASTAARGRAAASTASVYLDRLLYSVSEIISLLSSRSSRVNLTRLPSRAPSGAGGAGGADGAGVWLEWKSQHGVSSVRAVALGGAGLAAAASDFVRWCAAGWGSA
eukprot:4994258-Prymnesium_polylepis.1